MYLLGVVNYPGILSRYLIPFFIVRTSFYGLSLFSSLMTLLSLFTPYPWNHSVFLSFSSLFTGNGYLEQLFTNLRISLQSPGTGFGERESVQEACVL